MEPVNEVDGAVEQTPAPVLCLGVTTAGKPCRAAAQPGSRFCQWHDPAAKPLVPVSPPVEPPALSLPEAAALHSAGGLRALLAQVVVYTASAPAPDLPRVHALSSLAGPLLRSLDTQGLEEQLASAREEAAEARRQAYDFRAELERCRYQLSALTAAPTAAPPQAEVRRLQQHVAELARENTLLQERAAAEAARTADARAEASRSRAALSALSASVVSVRPGLCFHCARLLRRSGALPPASRDDPDFGDEPDDT